MKGFCWEGSRKRRCHFHSIDAKRQKPFPVTVNESDGYSSSFLQLSCSKDHPVDLISTNSLSSSRLSLLDMPAEIINNISSFLPVIDYVNFRSYVCRRFYSRAMDYPHGAEIFNFVITKDSKLIDSQKRAELIASLLDRRPFPIDPSENNNAAIKWLCMRGEIDSVKVLLGHPKVDPSSENNLCIRLASACGSLPMVNLLLNDSRVNPSEPKTRQSHIFENNAFLLAVMRGHEDIVRRMLQHHLVDPTLPNNAPFIFACAIGHDRVVKLLLADHRIDPSVLSNMPLLEASLAGHLHVVNVLLFDMRVQVTEDILTTVRSNACHSSAEIINVLEKRLLSQYQIN